jgi:hypothetical protein|tara:strand:+ start:157 stop:681 length:525 start_codon:yes stop_codon:yes gene_type:complete
MIDFNTFQLDRFSKLLETIHGYTDNNLRYPKAGELVEKALAEYSNGLLTRVNLPGVDLIGPGGTTYESKVTQFSNKSQMAVRGLILKNRRAAKEYEDKLADYFIITDVKKGKACCIPSSRLYNFKDTGAVMTASADPELPDFFLTGYNLLEERDEVRDYFDESDDFDLTFIRSI